ncbi:MAG: VTT domain-containing protein [Acidimicrobiales bacterium]
MRNWFGSIFAIGIDPEGLLRSFGGLATVALFGVIFAESGLLVGFFLPGDSLLFIAGFLSSDAGGNFLWPIWAVSLGCFLAAVAGDQVGYMFGKKAGPAIFRRPDSKIFKHKYLVQAEEFFTKHGPKTIIIARFVPIVRTFAPIVAGAGKMPYRTFVTYNVVGGFVWAVGFTQAGYWLGQTFPELGDSIEKIIIVIIIVSLLPVGIEILRHRRKAAKERALADEQA